MLSTLFQLSENNLFTETKTGFAMDVLQRIIPTDKIGSDIVMISINKKFILKNYLVDKSSITRAVKFNILF